MSVIRWNPLREFDQLFAHATQAQASRPVGRQAANTLKGPTFTPLADIAETETGYFIELELPGFAAADVAVTVHDGVLSVAGERKPTSVRDTAVASVVSEANGVTTAAAAAETAAVNSELAPVAETRRVHRTERAFGTFERHFALPKDADSNAVSATASNGVLTLEIGRLAEAARRAIEVKVA